MKKFHHFTLRRWTAALLAALAFVSLPALAQKEPDGQPKPLVLHNVELHQVTFEEPVRVGYGEGAQYYQEALEIRVEVDSFPEADAEPALWVGEVAVRGHRIVRGERTFTLAFDAFEPETLPVGGCIQVGLAYTEPAECRFFFDPAEPTPGTPLAERILRSGLGKPDFHIWDDTAPAQQCSGGGIVIGPPYYDDVEVAFYDGRDRRIDVLEPGDSLTVELTGVPARRQIEIFVHDDTGHEWAYARLSADADGNVPPTVVWYNTGVIGTTSREIGHRPQVAFETFEEAYEYWAVHDLIVELRTDEGDFVQQVELPVAEQRTQPLLYPSNEDGVLMNAHDLERDRFFVTGTHYPAGATVLLFVVENRWAWNVDDPFTDLTGEEGTSDVTVVELAPGETSFTVEPWFSERLQSGRYDLISRVVQQSPDPRLVNAQAQTVQATDIISFGRDTAALMFEIINGHIVMEIAGRELNLLPWYNSSWFEFADVFERNETVYGAVDPTDFPSWHTGGEYAAYYVVEKPANYWYWDATNPPLTDISGPGGSSQIEVAQVKYGCINVTRTAIWPNPDPADCISEYTVVVEFGDTPASSASSYVTDGVYDKGTDFIDRYQETGFWVVDDPADCCTYDVGRYDHYDDVTTGTDPNRAFDFTALGFPLVRNWFTIRYPAQAPGGIGAALPAGSDRYPVVLFLHGRHPTCATGGWFNPSCPPGDRIASHRGYDYILDSLAKQGYIAISVDAYDIQPSNALANYEVRGRLMLEHLNRMRDWDSFGSDPWSGFFQGRIDMGNVGIVGHSRGGEGAIAAAEINVNEAITYGHLIRAVVAIAPTDQDAGTTWDVEHSPYLLLMAAADGDVPFQGLRAYDVAFATGALPQFEKVMPWVHGANHNFWNSVWTPGSGDPWASDDGSWVTGPRLTAAEQRRTGLSPITGFMHQHLKGVEPYRQIFTGKLPLSAMRNDMMHWSYQHDDRKTLDDFQGTPNTFVNSLGGTVSYPGSVTVTEGGFGSCSSHSTQGGTLSWSTSGDEYESELPSGQWDVSAYSHLSFRVTQILSGTLNPVGQDKNLIVRIVDGDGDFRKVHTVDFRDIPYPYERTPSNRPCVMKTVRIPLRTFAMNNSDVDLDDIRKVVIELPSTGYVGIDEVQFSQ